MKGRARRRRATVGYVTERLSHRERTAVTCEIAAVAFYRAALLGIARGTQKPHDLPRPVLPGYVEADVRLAWRVTDALELSIAGFNLLDEGHPETGAPATRAYFGRTVYAGTRWGF